MNLTVEKVEALIVEAEHEVQESEAALAERKGVLRFMRRRLQSLEASTTALPGMGTTFTSSSPPSVSGMALPAAVQAVLSFAGCALHVRDIRKRLIESGYGDRKNLVISVTSAARRRTDLFVKVRKATYGLKNGAA